MFSLLGTGGLCFHPEAFTLPFTEIQNPYSSCVRGLPLGYPVMGYIQIPQVHWKERDVSPQSERRPAGHPRTKAGKPAQVNSS